MDQVLCIDLSLEPARAALVSVEQRKLQIVESRQFSLASELNISDLLEFTYVESNHHNDQNENNADTIAANDKPKLKTAAPLNSLVAAINDLPKTWINSVLIIPMNEYLSLNLTLPFSDQKNISKILDFEVQDVVPFEVDEFIIEGHSLSSIGANQFDVHVSLAPKRFIGNLLMLCRASGVEPSIITTPCSALAALPHLAHDYFKDTFALISITAQGVYLCASIDSLVRADKVITAHGLPTEDPQWFIPELKLALMALEKRYNKTFTNVYVDAPKKVISTLQQTLGRTVESLELADFAGNDHRESAASALSALYAGDEETLTPLTNFRVREFSFRPNWGALFRALGTIQNYFFGFVALLLTTLLIVYQVRQLQISRLRSAVQEQIRTTVPSINSALPGNEIPTFLGTLQALSKELESLGSSNEISPTNILVELTKDLKDLEKTTINEIDIRPDRVLLELSLPDYAAADRVEKLLKRKKEIFRRVHKEAAGSYASASGGRNFKFDLKLID